MSPSNSFVSSPARSTPRPSSGDYSAKYVIDIMVTTHYFSVIKYKLDLFHCMNLYS